MKRITVLGIDLAKSIFQLHGNDEFGKCILKKKISRQQLKEFVVRLEPCLIGMEACSSAHYWARLFSQMGHTVKLMAPQYVKPYVKTNKNDANDAEAIAEAVTRPNMRFVAMKSTQQQDIQNLHRVRMRLVRSRVALSNEIRGLLAEYGIVIAKSFGKLRAFLITLLDEENSELSSLTKEVMRNLYEEFISLDDQVAYYDKKLKVVFMADEVCQRLAKIEGVGVIISTAMVAAVSDPLAFKNGRQFSAWLGLVPKQNSSGGKTVLSGISKRGDAYLRTQLVHGARSVIARVAGKTDSKSQWLLALEKRRGRNKACLALANKTARIIWALMAKKQEYQLAA